MDSHRTELLTRGGVRVTRTATPFDPAELGRIAALVDERRGGVMSSGMEYPGRYSRWHMAYADPCAEIIATGRRVTARALNDRGRVVLPVIRAALAWAGAESTSRAETPPEDSVRRRRRPTRSSPRRSAAAGRRCSARCARSRRRSAARTRISAFTGRSAMTWPSSSSR